jgi:hypothetical protein
MALFCPSPISSHEGKPRKPLSTLGKEDSVNEPENDLNRATPNRSFTTASNVSGFKK